MYLVKHPLPYFLVQQLAVPHKPSIVHPKVLLRRTWTAELLASNELIVI